jgi:hypothetical protein
MLEIFIPVLVICMNGNCEFMQAHTHYTTEDSCRQQVDAQIERMKGLAAKGGKEIAIIEGTCITAKVKTIKGIEA